MRFKPKWSIIQHFALAIGYFFCESSCYNEVRGSLFPYALVLHPCSNLKGQGIFLVWCIEIASCITITM